MTSVPAQYQGYVTAAAKKLGIPAAVVAAQIQLESDWNPDAKSSAGAEGIAQFEPGTFKAYGPAGGSPYNVPDAFAAYTAYMADLLKQEGGDVRRALAAYNAGPGNLGAGYGYADTILSRAKTGDVTAAGGSGGTSTQPSSDSGSGGLLSIPGDVIKAFTQWHDSMVSTATFLQVFFQPSTYVRAGAAVGGSILIIFGVVALGLAAKKEG